MVQGLWQKINVIRAITLTDDSYGGAVMTGTYVYEGVPAAIAIFRPSLQSREQGLEVDIQADLTVGKIFNNLPMQLYERDEIEIVCPGEDPFYDKRFRITGVQPSKRPLNIGHIHCTLSRIEYSREKQ